MAADPTRHKYKRGGYSSRADYQARSPRAQQSRVDYGAGKPQTGQQTSASGATVTQTPAPRRPPPRSRIGPPARTQTQPPRTPPRSRSGVPARTQTQPQTSQLIGDRYKSRYNQPGNLRNWVADSARRQESARPVRQQRYRELRGLSPEERVRKQREYWNQRKSPFKDQPPSGFAQAPGIQVAQNLARLGSNPRGIGVARPGATPNFAEPPQARQIPGRSRSGALRRGFSR